MEQLVEEDNWEQDYDARSALFLASRLVTKLDSWSKVPERSTLFIAASQAVWEDDIEDRSEALCAARLVVEVFPLPHSPAQPSPPALCPFHVAPFLPRKGQCMCARSPPTSSYKCNCTEPGAHDAHAAE